MQYFCRHYEQDFLHPYFGLQTELQRVVGNCQTHNPPHFHARYNEYRAIIDIETGNVVGEMPKRALKLVLEWLELHKNELMENWRKMENGESLATINPLD